MMATRRVELGPTGDTVRANLARFRKAASMTLRDVADVLRDTDRPLAHNTISEIERGARRVDVDDLVALSAALGISPIALLAPIDTDAPDDPWSSAECRVSGVAETYPPRQVWEWLRANAPIDHSADDWEKYPLQLDDFRRASFPPWAYLEDKEVQRLLEIADPQKLQDDLQAYVEKMIRRTLDSEGRANGDD